MPTLGAALDFAKLEGKNFRAHQVGGPPGSPVKGIIYYDTADDTLKYYNGTIWVSASALAGGPPTGAAGGDLTGTYPNPTIGALKVTDAHVAAANKDGAVGTPSMRTLGSGAQQAMPGNTTVTPADATTGTKGIVQLAGDLAGTATSPQIAAGVITHAEVATANKDGLTNVPSMRTLDYTSQAAMPGNAPLNLVGPPASSVSLNNQKITNLAYPTTTTDAASKLYVDDIALGLTNKTSAEVATTGNITLSGVGQTIDGVSLPGAGTRVLVKDQTTPSQNGLYTTAVGAWSRAGDMDTWGEVPGSFCFVSRGTTQADTGWVCTADPGGTLGTTSITWVQFSAAGQITGGAGLLKTGNSLDVGAGAGITVNADTVQVANNGITNAMLADGAVDLATADVTNALPVTKGGTGQTTAKTARETGLAAAGIYTNAGFSAGANLSIPAATHGLRASRGLLVQVTDEASGYVELPDINVAANGDVTVQFAVSQAANSKRVTIIG